MKVKDNIAALMDAHLARNDHDHAVTHARDVDWSADVTSSDDAALNVLEGQACEGRTGPAVGGAARCRQSHVDDTLVQVCQSSGGGGTRGRGWQGNVNTNVLRQVNVSGCRKGRLANAYSLSCGVVTNLGIVVLATGWQRRGIWERADGILRFRLRGSGVCGGSSVGCQIQTASVRLCSVVAIGPPPELKATLGHQLCLRLIKLVLERLHSIGIDPQIMGGDEFGGIGHLLREARKAT